MPRLNEIAQLNHAVVIHPGKGRSDLRIAQLNARQVQLGTGLGQLALQADQLVGGNHVAFTQPFGSAGIGGALAYIRFTLGHLGRAVVRGQAKQ